MKLPLQVVFRDLVPLPSLEDDIRQRAAKLEQFAPDLISGHVTVEATANRRHQGHLYTVRIDLRLPGTEIVAGEHQSHEDMAVAVRDAFDAARRRLEDFERRRRGDVKHHEPRPAPRSRGAEDEEGATGAD